MKALLINGSPHKEGCTFTALNEIANTLKQEHIEAEIFHIGVKPIPGCIACGKCRETGKCIFDDDVNKLGARLDEFDAIVLGSPVYYAGPSGQMCSFCDRLFFSNSHKMAGKLAAAVVSCRRGGATSSFDRLNKYFVHGFTPDDVRKDKEGLQTMRTLGKNMAWLLKCIELGKRNGIERPEYEPITFTHFIQGENE